MGGLKKVQTALKRKAKNKMRKKLGMMKIPEGRRLQKKGHGQLAPIKSVMFVENTPGGELARRLTEAEMDLGKETGFRVRMAESAGSPLGVLLSSTNPWGPMDCTRHDCVPCGQDGDEKVVNLQSTVLAQWLLYSYLCYCMVPSGNYPG